MGDRNFECEPTCYEQNCVYWDMCDYDWKVCADCGGQGWWEDVEFNRHNCSCIKD